MKHYELLCVFPGTLGEEDLSGKIAQLLELVSAQGVEDLQVADQGKSRLAYPMKHIRYGYFWLLSFQAEPDKVAAIEQKLHLDGGLLRVVLTVYNKRQRVQKEVAMERMSQHSSVPAEHQRPVEAKDFSESAGATKDTMVTSSALELDQPIAKSVPAEESQDPAPVVNKDVQEKEKIAEKKKVSMEEIDEKLSQIIDDSVL